MSVRADPAPPTTAPQPGDAPAAPGRWERGEWWWVAALTGFVLVAGGWGLGKASLSGDEAATWAISSQHLGAVLHALGGAGGDRAAALYYLAAHVWITAFGGGAVALRAFSLVAAAAVVAPFHAIARRLGTARAVSAEVLLVTSPLFLLYARTARGYALLLLLTVLATWAFLRAVDSDTTRDWVRYTVIATVALYAHWFAALVIATQFLWWLAMRPEPGHRRRPLLVAGALIAAAAPVAILAAGPSGVGWIAPLSVAEVRALASAITGTSSWVEQLVFLAVIVVALSALVVRSRARTGRARWDLTSLAAAWLLVPVAATIVVSTIQPLLLSRYLIVTLPGYALTLAIGLSALTGGRRAAIAVGTAALVALSGAGYRAVWLRNGTDENWRSIAETVAARAGPRDAIVVDPPTASPAFGYYARRTSLAARRGPTQPAVAWAAPYRQVEDSRVSVATVTQVAAPRVWLVVRAPGGSTVRASVRHPAGLAAVQAALARRYRDVTQIVPPDGHATARLLLYSDPVG